MITSDLEKSQREHNINWWSNRSREFKFAVPRLGTAQLKKRNTFSIHFYNAGARTFGGDKPPKPPANSAYVESVKDLHYDERLNILGLMRLDKVRDKSDLITTFKILNGNYRVDKNLLFVPDDGGRWGHSRKLFKRRCSPDILNKNLLTIELLTTGTVFQITVLVALR